MKLYFFYTQTGHKVAQLECASDASAIHKAGEYADWTKNPVTVHTRNQHGEIIPLPGVIVYPAKDWLTGKPIV